MRILTSLYPLAFEKKEIVLAAGFFDGVHLGHRSVLEATIRYAREIDAQAWALTFDPHPLTILRPEQRPPLLTSTGQRLELLADVGLDGCLLMHFTPQLSRVTAEAFVKTILTLDGWSPRAIFSGENWRFGAGGKGVPQDITKLSEGKIEARVVRPLLQGETPVSSSRIRTAIKEGQVELAASLLGRLYHIRSRVVEGRGIGRKLGFATANLVPEAEALPPYGIYAVWAGYNGKVYPAVASYGVRPTFAGQVESTPVLEVHLLDCNRNLYGRELDVAFVAHLRDEKRFPTPAALIASIEEDIKATRQILKDPPSGVFPVPHSHPVPRRMS